ncbi:MAG: hypothetical protein R3332_10190 [Pseudohongiellaceae bacterium]|nr:hypothetical protein [Pseudohongiellaceae bacterium]
MFHFSKGEVGHTHYPPHYLMRLSLLALPVFLVMFFTYLALGFQLDDAMIYLRYVRNFHEGQGLSYNVDESFSGLTSGLYSAILIAGAYIVSNLQLLTIGLSALFFLIAVLLGGQLFSRSHVEAAICSSALACTAFFYSTFGMETGLFLCLISYSLYLYKKQSQWFVVALALCCITRTEGVFLALVLGLDYVFRHKSLPDWRLVILSAVIFVSPILFNWLYYGVAFPATANAKIAQGSSGLWGESWIFLNVHYFKGVFFSGSAFAIYLLVAASAAGFLLSIRYSLARLVLAFLVLLLGFYLLLNIPNYHWYDAPFVFYMVIFACRSLFLLGGYVWRSGPSLIRVPVVALLLAMAVYAQYHMVSFEKRGPNAGYVEMGQWLEDNADQDASVAMVEIGTIGWYSQRRIIDILGLVSPYNADYIGRREFMSWLLHYQPEYIVRHDPVWVHEQSVLPLEKKGLYKPVQEVDINGLVLLKRAQGAKPEQIKEYVAYIIDGQRALKTLQQSSDQGPPVLVMEADALFAHAPSKLELNFDRAIHALDVEFGIREAAQGLHNKLCFKISNSDSQQLFHHCIAKGAPVEDMRVSRRLLREVNVGESLLFEIYCETSCDYAWTYWSQVQPVNALGSMEYSFTR